MSEMTYTPISCSYYDHLEGFATQKVRCEIVYRESITGKNHEYFGRIVDIYAKNQEEFMVMDNRLTVRLDHLASINGMANPSFAFEQENS